MSAEPAYRLMGLKVILTVHAAGVLAQAVFAGQFLSGDDGAVAWHETAAWCIVCVCLIQLVVPIALKAAPLWFAICTVGEFLGEGLQIGTGYGRFLGVHIPLSILIAGGVISQLAWLFRARRRDDAALAKGIPA